MLTLGFAIEIGLNNPLRVENSDRVKKLAAVADVQHNSGEARVNGGKGRVDDDYVELMVTGSTTVTLTD